MKQFIAQKDEECSHCEEELPRGSIIWCDSHSNEDDDELLCDECYHNLKEEL